MALARGKLTAKLLLLEGRFNQTPGAPYAKTALWLQRTSRSGWRIVQIAITLLPTSAQERRLSSIFQRRSSACCLQPFTTTGRKIQPLLLDLAKQLRLTSFTFDFTAHGTPPRAAADRLPAHGVYGAARWIYAIYVTSRYRQSVPVAATPRWWQSSHSGDIADQPPK